MSPADSAHLQRPLKSHIGFPMLPQFEPMLELGPLDDYPAHPCRISRYVCINFCFHHFFLILYFSDWALAIRIRAIVLSAG